MEGKRANFSGNSVGGKEWQLIMFIIAFASALSLLLQLLDNRRGLGKHGESRKIRFTVQMPGNKLWL